MINNVSLTGRLTRDVELRYTQSGTAVGSFTLAVDRQFKNNNGERETDFINCVIWRKGAEIFSNYTHKGAMVGVTGRLQTRNYDNNQGQKVYVTEVVVSDFAFLEPKGSNNGQSTADNNNFGNPGFGNNAGNTFGGSPQQPAAPQFGSNPNSTDNNGNGNNGNPTADPFANASQPIDISDDDLPF